MRELKLKTPPSDHNDSRAIFQEPPGSKVKIQFSVKVTEEVSPDEWKGVVKTSTIQGSFAPNQEVTMTRKNGDIFTVK